MKKKIIISISFENSKEFNDDTLKKTKEIMVNDYMEALNKMLENNRKRE